ncbi:MAG TPA: hypothetical protein VMS56_15180 [Thermoanaerobaculia bacterium]|nr:hypothetical protein [Thermoanaerobaculia bacterium]
MKLGVSLEDDLVTFANEEASRRGTTRSGLIAELLRAEKIRRQVTDYIDRHGWDVTEDEGVWREYQSRRFEQEYGSDEW